MPPSRVQTSTETLDNSTGGTWRLRRTVCTIVGMGILLGSTWASRNQALFGSNLFSSYTGVAGVAAALVFMAIPHAKMPSSRALFRLAIVFMVLHLGAVAMTLFLRGNSDVMALGIVSSIFEGASVTLLETLFLIPCIGLDRKCSSIMIAGAFLFANVYDCIFIGASVPAVEVAWISGLPIAIAIYRWMSSGIVEDVHLGGGEARGAYLEDGKGRAVGAATFSTFVIVFMLLQGVSASITGFGGVGVNAFFDTSSAILVIGVRIFVLMFCAAFGDDLSPIGVIGSSAIIWSVGLVLEAVFWGAEMQFAGALVLEAGFYILQVFALTATVDYASSKSGESMNIISAMVAFTSCNQVSRLLAHLVLGKGSLDLQDIAIISLAGLLVILFLVVVLLCLKGNISGKASAEAFESASPAEQIDPYATDPIVKNGIEFCLRFEGICEDKQLASREREVLFEAVHGYTIEKIADKLCLSRETVKTYLSRAYAKAGVSSKQAFIALMDTYPSKRCDAAEK